MIPTRDYLEIVRDLEELAAYLTSLGVWRDPVRLQGMIANLKEIEQLRTQHQLATLDSHPRREELVWSLVEALEFSEIFHGIHGYNPDIVKRLMQTALAGPLHPIDETLNSNIARNIVFELALGARLRRAGADVTLGQEADLLIKHAGARLYIECKRPLYERSVRQNIKKARAQLRRRFDVEEQDDSLGGLVAISISKAVNPGSKMFIVKKAEDLKQLSNDVLRFHQVYCADFNRQVDPRLIGILYHIYTPARVLDAAHPLIAASHSEIFLANRSLEAVFPLTGEGLKQLLAKL